MKTIIISLFLSSVLLAQDKLVTDGLLHIVPKSYRPVLTVKFGSTPAYMEMGSIDIYIHDDSIKVSFRDSAKIDESAYRFFDWLQKEYKEYLKNKKRK